MRKSLLLFLALAMILSTLCGVAVMADESAVALSLAGNKTFITEVDETKSLVVTPLDASGKETSLPDGTTFAYETSRPWVLGVDADGKFVDGGYDGTTVITVTASNGLTASTIFIKNSNNAYADWSYATGDSTDHYGGDFVGSREDGSKIRYRGTWIDGKRRFDVNADGVSDADKAASKIPGENYYKLATTATSPNLDNSIVSGYDNLNDAAKASRAGWYNEGLRVLQGWFYDDGTSAVHLRTYMSQSSSYLNGEGHVNWETDIKAVEDSKAYTVAYNHNVDEASKVYNEIKRSKGWHQATLIMDDTKTVEIFIDGKLLASAKVVYKATTDDKIAIAGASAGNYDEFVIAANPNTEKPEDYVMPEEPLKPAESISLSRNKTFIKEVDETKSIIVTPLDKNGKIGELPEGTTFTYETSRPWVLGVDADGKFTDGGYDGSTTITVTASNGLKASAIFIKNSNNIYADTSYVTAETTDNDTIAGGVGDAGLRFRGTWIDNTYGRGRVDVKSANATDEEKAAAKVPGENYFRMPVIKAEPTCDGNIVTGYDEVKKQEAKDNKQSWYKEGLRIMQGWFYDDGTSPVHMRSYMSETSDYLAGALTGSLGSGISHLYWVADIKAAEGSEAYSVNYTHAVTANSEYTIKRSKGWHQATTVLNDDMSVDVFIDGELLSTSKSAKNEYVNYKFYLACGSVGNFDELVVAANPNTKQPADYDMPEVPLEPAVSITLSRNKTFVKEVDETKAIIVTPLDKDGNKGELPEGTTFTYESTRPWVLGIADNGKFVDGGYDGTTKVTVTASNGMKASAIFIKNADDIYADTSYATGDSTDNYTIAEGVGVGLRYRGTYIVGQNYNGRFNVNAAGVSDEDKAVSKIPGENYLKMKIATDNPGPDTAIVTGYDAVNANAQEKKQGWYKEGLRVMQGWFYDDGESAVQMRSYMTQHSDYLPGFNHISWKGDVKAVSGADNYSIDYVYAVKENTEHTIKRSKGWHQVTTILNDDLSVDVFIDGELLSTSKSANSNDYYHGFWIAAASVGNFDEMVVATNPNTEMPADFLERTIGASVEGIVKVGQTIIATPVVKDEYGPITGETYQWQKLVGDTWTDIAGATASTFKITDSELGYKLRVVIKPGNGAAAESDATVEVTKAIESVPVVSGLTVTGTYEIGETLNVGYTYKDSELGDGTDNSIVIFEVSSTIDGKFTPVQSSASKSYIISPATKGQYLRVRIIPKDSTGISGEEVCTTAVKVSGTVAFFVSKDGNDNNPGTIDAPFATIEKARNTIRGITEKPEGGITVNIRGGIYELNRQIGFDPVDSGTENCPIIYQAYNGEEVSFVGGKELDTSKIKPVTDGALLDRLIDQNVRNNIYQLDLRAQGVEMSPVEGNGWYKFPVDQPSEIFMNGTRLTRARWPNDDDSQMLLFAEPFIPVDLTKYNGGNMPVKMVYPDAENRTNKWNFKPNDMVVGGAIAYAWACAELKIDQLNADEKWFTTSDSYVYGVDPTTIGWGPQRKIYFANIFEEIDVPGESYVDREAGILYFYPVGKIEDGEMIVSTVKNTLLAVHGASNITFKGIDFKDSRGSLVSVTSSDNIKILDGELSGSASQAAIHIKASKNVNIAGNHIYNIAGNAIKIENCGDRLNCESSGVVIENNNLHTVSYNYGGDGGKQAIGIYHSCGVVIRHNEISDCKSLGILTQDTNDTIIEYNRFVHTMTFATDSGAIYWGRDVTSLGNVIRYNYFEDISSKFVQEYLQMGRAESVFVDDAGTGPDMYGNVFLNGGAGSSYAWTTNTGAFFNCHNNIIINTDNRAQWWSGLTSWHDSDNYKYTEDGKTVNVDSTTSIIPYIKMMDFEPFVRNRSTTTDNFTDARQNLMFSDEWKEHYKGTNWERTLEFYSKERYEKSLEYVAAKDRIGLFKYLEGSLTQGLTNKVHNNLTVGVTQINEPGKSEFSNNYMEGDLNKGKSLFKDFDGKDFTLTAEGLAQVRTVAKDFENIDFGKIGLYENSSGYIPGGNRPAAEIKDEIINGIAAAGNTITPAYNFSDADGDGEGNSKVYWYVADKENGEYSIIRGKATKNFAVTDEYGGRYLKYEIIPYDQNTLRGEMVASGIIPVRKSSSLDFTVLGDTISEARSLLAGAEIGDGIGQYPKTAADELSKAIEEALAVAENDDAYQFLINQTVDKLKNAIDTFKKSANIIIGDSDINRININSLIAGENQSKWVNGLDGGKIEFTKDGSMILAGNGESTAAVYTGKLPENAEITFKMKMESVDGKDHAGAWAGIYFRQDIASGWGWKSTCAMFDLKQNLVQYQQYPELAVISDLVRNDKHFVMGKEHIVTVGVYDIDKTEKVMISLSMDGEKIYSDVLESNALYGKDGYFVISSSDNDHQTRLIISPVYADKTALSSTIDSANEFLAGIKTGTGYGEYSADAVNELKKALEEAKTVSGDKDVVQYLVDEADLAIRKALTAAKSSATFTGTITEDKQIVINYNNPKTTLSAADGVDDVVLVIDSGKLLPNIVVTSQGAEFEVAEGTVISDNFKLPLASENAPGGTFGLGSVVKTYANGSAAVTADKPVRIVLKGQRGKYVAYKDGNKYTAVSRTLREDSFEAAQNMLKDGVKAVKLTSGNDIVIYTILLTEFVTYIDDSSSEPTPDNQGGSGSSGSGGGGGGGGGGSSSAGNKVTYDATENNVQPVTPPEPEKFVFDDVKGHWSEKDVMAMYEAGIVSGVSENSFEPERNITRAEFATLVVKALGITPEATDDFEDVKDEWFATFVGAAAKAGIIAGSDGKFRPNDTITRQEMAVIVVKAYDYLEKSSENAELSFADKDSIAGWATDYVAKAVGAGLISGMGDGSFGPELSATRAQAASVISRIIK